jgi:HPt (histidine-containing phosphotransfer) domain-containing protein
VSEVVDEHRLRAVCGGDDGVGRELLELLVSEAMALYERALDDEQDGDVGETAHALKGMAGNVGAPRLEAAAAALELAVGNDAGTIEGALATVADALEEIRAYVDGLA